MTRKTVTESEQFKSATLIMRHIKPRIFKPLTLYLCFYMFGIVRIILSTCQTNCNTYIDYPSIKKLMEH